MDNGINIKDDKLKNIVIMAWERVTFIQELGRIRIDIENPSNINLYIPLRYKKSFKNKIMNCEKCLNLVELHRNDEITFNRKFDNSLDKIGEYNCLFYKEKNTGKWAKNIIGVAKITKDKKFFEHMVNRFEEEGEFAYVYQQLEWLELRHTFSEENLMTEVLLSEDIQCLEEYLESFIGKKILEDEQMILKEKLTNKAYKIDRSMLQGTKKMHVNTFNNIMQRELKLPYEAKSKTSSKRVDGMVKKYTYWEIDKINL